MREGGRQKDREKEKDKKKKVYTYCPQAQKEPQGIHHVDVGTCSERCEQGAEGTHRLTHPPHPLSPIPGGQPAPGDLGEDVPVITSTSHVTEPGTHRLLLYGSFLQTHRRFLGAIVCWLVA